MGHPRPRPVAEASPLADALETLAPVLEQIEAFEAMRSLLVFAIRWHKEIEALRIEHANLSAAIPRLKAARDEWAAAVDDAKRAAMALEQRGIRVELPASITGRR
jgi:hypothetical protein